MIRIFLFGFFYFSTVSTSSIMSEHSISAMTVCALISLANPSLLPVFSGSLLLLRLSSPWLFNHHLWSKCGQRQNITKLNPQNEGPNKYIFASIASCKVVWLRKLFRELFEQVLDVKVICCDNKSGIRLE